MGKGITKKYGLIQGNHRALPNFHNALTRMLSQV
jgi:hypothetical protein